MAFRDLSRCRIATGLLLFAGAAPAAAQDLDAVLAEAGALADRGRPGEARNTLRAALADPTHEAAACQRLGEVRGLLGAWAFAETHLDSGPADLLHGELVRWKERTMELVVRYDWIGLDAAARDADFLRDDDGWFFRVPFASDARVTVRGRWPDPPQPVSAVLGFDLADRGGWRFVPGWLDEAATPRRLQSLLAERFRTDLETFERTAERLPAPTGEFAFSVAEKRGEFTFRVGRRKIGTWSTRFPHRLAGLAGLQGAGIEEVEIGGRVDSAAWHAFAAERMAELERRFLLEEWDWRADLPATLAAAAAAPPAGLADVQELARRGEPAAALDRLRAALAASPDGAALPYVELAARTGGAPAAHAAWLEAKAAGTLLPRVWELGRSLDRAVAGMGLQSAATDRALVRGEAEAGELARLATLYDAALAALAGELPPLAGPAGPQLVLQFHGKAARGAWSQEEGLDPRAEGYLPALHLVALHTGGRDDLRPTLQVAAFEAWLDASIGLEQAPRWLREGWSALFASSHLNAGGYLPFRNPDQAGQLRRTWREDAPSLAELLDGNAALWTGPARTAKAEAWLLAEFLHTEAGIPFRPLLPAALAILARGDGADAAATAAFAAVDAAALEAALAARREFWRGTAGD
ncbi:MAG TPA: hypothetical protein VGC54_14925 [Planctomycetota bacterium]